MYFTNHLRVITRGRRKERIDYAPLKTLAQWIVDANKPITLPATQQQQQTTVSSIECDMAAVLLFYICSKPEFSHCFRMALNPETRELKSVLYTGQVPDMSMFRKREFVRPIDRALFVCTL